MTLSKKRQGRITSSNAGAILGLDPNRSRDDVLRSMVREYHGAESEVDKFAEEAVFAHGKFYEPQAIGEFEMETGLTVTECGFFIHPDHDWLGATPDGLVGDDAVAEIKCPWGKRNDDPPVFKTAEEQRHYYAQMQIEMACANRVKAHFYRWTPYGSAHEVVHANLGWLSTAIPELRRFYDEYLAERELPAAQKHLEPKRRVIENKEAAMLLEEYDDLADAIEKAGERKKEVMARLVQIAGERDAEVCGRLLTKVERAGAISYAKAIKELAPGADLEPWRGKPSEYWKLS